MAQYLLTSFNLLWNMEEEIYWKMSKVYSDRILKKVMMRYRREGLGALESQHQKQMRSEVI